MRGNFMIGFFLAGFICFILGIHIYLRREDTQWHKTVDMIKSLTDMQISDKYKTDNTLNTIIKVVDDVRLDHAKETTDIKLSHMREVEKFRQQLIEVTSHLTHLRSENHKTQILLTQINRDKNNDTTPHNSDIFNGYATSGYAQADGCSTETPDKASKVIGKNPIIKKKLIKGKSVKVRKSTH